MLGGPPLSQGFREEGIVRRAVPQEILVFVETREMPVLDETRWTRDPYWRAWRESQRMYGHDREIRRWRARKWTEKG